MSALAFLDGYREARSRLVPVPARLAQRQWTPPACAKVYVPQPEAPDLTPTQQAILARLIYTPIPVPADSLAFGVDAASIRVHLSKLRKQVAGRGIEIGLIKHRGYFLPDECRDAARRLLEAQR